MFMFSIHTNELEREDHEKLLILVFFGLGRSAMVATGSQVIEFYPLSVLLGFFMDCVPIWELGELKN